MIYYDAHNVKVLTTIPEHIKPITDHMREADRQEIYSGYRLDPATALLSSLKSSVVCLAVLYHECPVAMFGIAPSSILGNTASVWLLGTDGIQDMRIQFLKLSKRFINMFLDAYPVLENTVDVRNLASIRWLKWVGAEFYEPKPFGVDQVPFQHFTIRRK